MINLSPSSPPPLHRYKPRGPRRPLGTYGTKMAAHNYEYTAKLYRRLIVIGQHQAVKTRQDNALLTGQDNASRQDKTMLSLESHGQVMKETNEELSYQYVVIFITDLEFTITLVFKKPIAILTSTSTIDINVPTSQTRIVSSIKQKILLLHSFTNFHDKNDVWKQ